MATFWERLRRSAESPSATEAGVDAGELEGVFAAPRWLRDAGSSAWLLFGVFVLVGAVVWLLALTQVIVLPVITAAVIAAVAGQPVGWLKRRGIPRGLGSAIVLLGIVAAGCLAGFLILKGIASETGDIGAHLSDGVEKAEGWLKDAGISDSKAEGANADVSEGASKSFDGLVHGVVSGVSALSSIVFFLAMLVLSLLFMLLDGPRIRAWIERNTGLPPDVAHTVGSRTLESLRGYFLGVTIVAVFNAVLVGGGAWLLGVPLAGTIAIVTFLGAYVPYIGAWSAGAFSVVIALGGSGEEAAAGMVAIQLLSNGPLQQVVQPIAYGAALGIHPLAVLIVTIAGGALFGGIGLILAAPLTSAVVRITADLSPAKA